MRMDEASDVWMRNWLETSRFRSGERHSQPYHGNLFCGQGGRLERRQRSTVEFHFWLGWRANGHQRPPSSGKLNLVVASSPFGVHVVSKHLRGRVPQRQGRRRRKWRKLRNACFYVTYIQSVGNTLGDVAQLVRALPCHGRGRGFEPRRPRHKPKKSKGLWHSDKISCNPRGC
jgi:hypothetical protein